MVFRRIRLLFFATLLLCSAVLSSCYADNADPQALLTAMRNAEKPLPAGQTYLLSAAEESEQYLPRELLNACYGNGKTPPEMDGVLDAALFLSYNHPCELAIFLCKTSAHTDAVAKMCLRRLDAVRRYYESHPDASAESQTYLENACVTVHGRWVVLCISSDPDTALRAFKRSI